MRSFFGPMNTSFTYQHAISETHLPERAFDEEQDIEDLGLTLEVPLPDDDQIQHSDSNVVPHL